MIGDAFRGISTILTSRPTVSGFVILLIIAAIVFFFTYDYASHRLRLAQLDKVASIVTTLSTIPESASPEILETRRLVLEELSQTLSESPSFRLPSYAPPEFSLRSFLKFLAGVGPWFLLSFEMLRQGGGSAIGGVIMAMLVGAAFGGFNVLLPDGLGGLVVFLLAPVLFFFVGIALVVTFSVLHKQWTARSPR